MKVTATGSIHWKKFLIGIRVVTRCNTLPAPHHVAPPPRQNHIKISSLYNGIVSDNARITFLSGVLPAEVAGNVIVGSLIRRSSLHRPPSSNQEISMFTFPLQWKCMNVVGAEKGFKHLSGSADTRRYPRRSSSHLHSLFPSPLHSHTT